MRLDLRAPAPMRLRHLLSLACKIEFSAAPGLSGTYACDRETLTKLREIAIDYALGLGFPLDADHYNHTTIDGQLRQLSGDQLLALYRALRDYVTLLGYYATRDDATPPPQPIMI